MRCALLRPTVSLALVMAGMLAMACTTRSRVWVTTRELRLAATELHRAGQAEVIGEADGQRVAVTVAAGTVIAAEFPPSAPDPERLPVENWRKLRLGDLATGCGLKVANAPPRPCLLDQTISNGWTFDKPRAKTAGEMATSTVAIYIYSAMAGGLVCLAAGCEGTWRTVALTGIISSGAIILSLPLIHGRIAR